MKIKILTIIIWILSSNVVSIFAQEAQKTQECNPNYLTFKSTTTTKSKIKIENFGGNNPDIKYSTDGSTWTQFVNKTPVTVDDVLYVRGSNPDGFSHSETQYTKFTVTNSPEVTGSLMSLIDGSGKQTEIPCEYCFYSLFNGCKTLKSVPELIATTLKEGCYKLMFNGCTQITTMPYLPASTLAPNCYESMFSGCTNLKNTKPLQAETLADGCYKEIFKSCTNVNNIVINFDNLVENATTDWLANAANEGTIICSKQLESETISKITPDNWILRKPEYLKITAQEDKVDISLNSEGTAKCNIEYSFDGLNFEPYTTGEAIHLQHQGDFVYLSGNNPTKFSSSSNNYHHFNIAKTASVSGSVMSLLDRYGLTKEIPNTNCFYYLFAECNITTPPLLPATVLKDNCYNSMFYGCSSLIQAPDLNATTLAKQCYKSMFANCTSLVDAPELKATSTIAGCYNNMFEGCSSLKNLKISFTSWTDENGKPFTSSWFNNASVGGIAICPEELDLKSRTQSTIPSTWLANPHKVYIKDGETDYFNITSESVYSMTDKVLLELTKSVPTIKGYENGVSAKSLTSQSEIEINKNSSGLYFYMPNDDVEISAIYIPKKYNITAGEYVQCEIKSATVESEPIPFTVTDRTKEGYKLSNVKINKDVFTESYTGSFKMSDFANDVTLTANYALIIYSVKKDDNITNLSKTKPTYKDTVRFKIKDLTSKGYAFKHILINGKPKASENFYDSVMMANYMCDIELKAEYEPITYNITAGEYITCNTKTATVKSEPIPFTVADRTNEGYELTKVASGTKSIPVENYAGSFLMSDFAKDVNLIATYTPIKYNISKDDYISCRKTTGTVKDTIRFKIKDLTSTGYAFKTLFVNNVARTPSTLADSVIMAQYLCDVKISTEYEPITYNITAGEYITCNTTTATVKSEPIPFTVADRTKEGYELTKVASGTKSIPFENYAGTFSMSDFAKDVNLIATYTPIKYNISKDDNISCRKTTGTVNDTIRFTIKDLTSKGYAFKTLFVNDVARTPSTLADSVIMAQYLCDVKITTEYEPITYNITAGEYITCNTKTATVESEPIPFTVTDRTKEGYELTKVASGTKSIPFENYAGSFLMSDFAKDVNLIATYTPIKYNISKDDNISCRKTTATVEDEISFTIKNLTSTGWQLKKVFVNSQEISFQDYSASFKMIDYLKDVNITAEYELITYNITAGEYITCNTTTATVTSEPIPFTVADRTNEGYELTKVASGTKSIPVENYAGTFSMSDFAKDINLIATYTPIKYNISKDDNISCRKTTGTVNDTIRFTIKDLTSKGYAFKTLFVNDVARTPYTLADSVIMAQYLCDVKISTEYEPINLNITHDEYITCKTKTATVKSDEIPFSVADRTAEGYSLSKVNINTKIATITDYAGSFLMSDFAKDVTIKATYTPIKYKITKDENISCQKTTATVEDEITFKIKNLTSSGFVLSKVFVNAQEINFQDYSASFKMADYISDVNISAEYQHLDYKITTDENCIANQQFANIDDLIKITAADLTNSGYELKNIFVNGKSITFYKNFCNFMMSDYKSDVEVTTQYKPITYKVKTGNNVYSDNNTATVSDTILFTVDDLSDKGKIFEGILVNGQQIDIEGFNDTIFMSDYISDINIEALYSKYNSITTDNNVVEISHTTAQQGDLITFKINKALAGYEPMVYVNSRSLSSPDSVNYSFSMFNNDVNIYVEYQEIVIEEPDTHDDNDSETEPEIIKRKKPTALNKVKTYPSLAKEGEIITISLENIDSEYLTDSKIIICNITGKVMKTIDNPQEMIKLTLPQGLYKGVLISGDKKFKFDFLITK